MSTQPKTGGPIALRLPAPAVAMSPAAATSPSSSTASSTSIATTAAVSTSTATAVATATDSPGGAIVIDPPTFPATVGDGRHPVVGIALVHNHAAGMYRMGEVYVTANTSLAFGLARNAFADCPDLTLAPGGSCAVALVFVPPAPGPYTARIGVSGLLAGRHEIADAPLLGLATAPATPTATISPTPVSTAVPTSTPTSVPTATTRAVPPTEPPHPTPFTTPMLTSRPTNTSTRTPTATAANTATAVPTPAPTVTTTAVHGSTRLTPVAIWLVAGVGRARWRDAPLAEGPAGQRVTVVIAAAAGARVRVEVRAYSMGQGAGHALTLFHHVEVVRADIAGHVRVALPLSVERNERVRVGALDLDAPAWRCVRSPRLVACAPGRPRAGSPTTNGRASNVRSLL